MNSLKELSNDFLKKSNIPNCVVKEDVTEHKLGIIEIDSGVLFTSNAIAGALNFKEYDVIVFFENPVIDILNGYQTPKQVKNSYNTCIVGFNNQTLMDEYYNLNMNGEDLYEYCQNNNLKVKTLFSNILVREKMKLFGVKVVKNEG